MAPFVPPESLDFDFYRPYPEPDGGNLVFRLYNAWESEWSTPWKFTVGAVDDGYDFVPDPTSVIISLDVATLDIYLDLQPDPVTITATLGEGLVDYVGIFHPDPTRIIVGLNQAVLEEYLELQPDQTDVVVTLGEGRTESTAGFHSDPTTIIIRLGSSSLEELIDLQPAPIAVKVGLQSGLLQILPDMLPDSTVVKVHLGASIMRGTEPQHLPIGIATGGHLIGWRTRPKKINKVYSMPWNKSIETDLLVSMSVKEPIKTDRHLSIAWRTMLEVDSTISAPYTKFDTLDRSFSSSYYRTMGFRDLSMSANHKSWMNANIDASISVPYKEPGGCDRYFHVPYKTEALTYDKSVSIVHNEPGGCDRHYHIPYGPKGITDICTYDYLPPDGDQIVFEMETPIGDVPDGDTIYVYFESSRYPLRCLPHYHKNTGGRDTPSGPPVLPPYNYPIPQKVYYMYNTVLVKELTTNTPIEVLGVQITTDRSSWLWQFNITVASRQCLALLKPANGVFATIVINMNGWEFYCTVEGWSENRRFGGDTWTITGRSHSLMFGSPVSPKIDWTEDSGMHGEQLATSIVTGKSLPTAWPTQLGGWTMNWDFYYTTGNTQTGFYPNTNWYIPGGTMQYTDANEIDVIRDIVGGIGAYVQTEPNTNVFTVKPLYAHMPWNWGTDNNSIEFKPITDSQFIEVARNFVQYAPCQAVHVIGESQGGNTDGSIGTPGGAIFTDVRYMYCSSSSAKYAPMVSNKYVTSSKAALELGRMTIGASGDWVQHTIRLGIMCPPGSAGLGLFRVGDMITVMEGTLEWQGQVTGVTITAANATGGAFAIDQTLAVEEYIGGLPSCKEVL